MAQAHQQQRGHSEFGRWVPYTESEIADAMLFFDCDRHDAINILTDEDAGRDDVWWTDEADDE